MSAAGLAKARVAVESKKHKKAGGEPPASLQDARRVLAEEKPRLAVLLHGAGVNT